MPVVSLLLRGLLVLALVLSGPGRADAHAHRHASGGVVAAHAEADADAPPCHALPDAATTTSPAAPDDDGDCCRDGRCGCAALSPPGTATPAVVIAPAITRLAPDARVAASFSSRACDTPQRPPIA